SGAPRRELSPPAAAPSSHREGLLPHGPAALPGTGTPGLRSDGAALSPGARRGTAGAVHAGVGGAGGRRARRLLARRGAPGPGRRRADGPGGPVDPDGQLPPAPGADRPP